MQRALTAAVSALLASAAGATTTAVASDALVFVPARKLVRTTVGCTLMDLGGLDKEEVAYRAWSQKGEKILPVTGGETFVDGKTEDAVGARALADGLKRLGVRVVAPAAADLVLPPALLTELVARSGARWIATNVRGKNLELETAHTEALGGSTVRVFSVVRCDASLRRAGWRCTPPDTALGSALKKGIDPGDFVAVVATVPPRQLDALVRRFPRVNAWLDGTGQHPTGTLEARSTTGFVAAAPGFGQFAVRIELAGTTGASGLFADPLLLEDARKDVRTPRSVREQIERFPWNRARAVRFHIDPIRSP
jgi:hypothetical protein